MVIEKLIGDTPNYVASQFDSLGGPNDAEFKHPVGGAVSRLADADR